MQYNNTYDPEYRVRTGLGDISDIEKIISYGGKKSMEWFMGNAAQFQDCNGNHLSALCDTYYPEKDVQKEINS